MLKIRTIENPLFKDAYIVPSDCGTALRSTKKKMETKEQPSIFERLRDSNDEFEAIMKFTCENY